MTRTMIEAATARAAGGVLPAHRPAQRRALAHLEDSRGAVLGTMRARPAVAFATASNQYLVSSDGTGFAPVTFGTGTTTRAATSEPAGPGVLGCASVVEAGYEMHDMFGPYMEVVDRGAFAETLAAGPLVEFTLNHNRGGNAPMAHTRNGTLALSMDEEGLQYDATVDPTRTDVADVLKALERGDLAESSFKFHIDAGTWSPDYTEYRITKVNLDRGDVSTVNFGANPAATSGLRSFDETMRILRAELSGLADAVRRTPAEVVPDDELVLRTIPGL